METCVRDGALHHNSDGDCKVDLAKHRQATSFDPHYQRLHRTKSAREGLTLLLPVACLPEGSVVSYGRAVQNAQDSGRWCVLPVHCLLSRFHNNVPYNRAPHTTFPVPPSPLSATGEDGLPVSLSLWTFLLLLFHRGHLPPLQQRVIPEPQLPFPDTGDPESPERRGGEVCV